MNTVPEGTLSIDTRAEFSHLTPGEIANLSDDAISSAFLLACGAKDIQDVHQTLRGSNQGTWGYFLGKHESLIHSIRSDANLIQQIGVPYEAIFDPLHNIIRHTLQSSTLFETHPRRCIVRYLDGYTVEQDIFVRYSAHDALIPNAVNHPMHSEDSPFSFSHRKKEQSNVDITIVDPQGNRLFCPGLVVGVGPYDRGFKSVHFFEGRGSPYRLSPARAIEVLPGHKQPIKALARQLGIKDEATYIGDAIKKSDSSFIHAFNRADQYYSIRHVFDISGQEKIISDVRRHFANDETTSAIVESSIKLPVLIEEISRKSADDITAYLTDLLHPDSTLDRRIQRTLALLALNEMRSRQEELPTYLSDAIRQSVASAKDSGPMSYDRIFFAEDLEKRLKPKPSPLTDESAILTIEAPVPLEAVVVGKI